MALKRSLGMKSGLRRLKLLVDGGGENKSEAVNELEAKGHFKKQVAQFDISYSNSIVEALFRQLKHNYLYSQDIKNHKSLTQHANFWFTDHNEQIPHTAFSGETPLERFTKSWRKEEEIKIVVRHEDAIKLRIAHNQKVFCQLCDVA